MRISDWSSDVCSSDLLSGSRAVAGTLDLSVLALADAEGTSLQEALVRFGCDPAAIAGEARRRDSVAAFVEVHIEQGPVLEAADLPVGTVTAIHGASRFAVTVEGMAGPAGTVGSEERRVGKECVRTCKSRW